MLPILRPHQQANLEELRHEVSVGRDPLLVAACGYGKGTIGSVIVHGAVIRNKSVVFAVHGKSLVVDMSERVGKLGIQHGVLLGGHRRERWHSVQVASIDTLHRMEHQPHMDLMIIDEAHMCLSPTWRKAVDALRAVNPAMRILGMTATPIRLDGKGLGKNTGGLFDSMIQGPSEEELIGLGNLVKSRVIWSPSPDTSRVKKTAGEFNQKQLADVCDKTKIIGDIITHWKKYGAGRKTAAFGVDQAHAKHITEQFQAAGYQWAYVDAETKQEDRAAIWRDLDTGSLMGVSSVGCIAVGWDHPVVSCLIMARPTQSLGLWRQMLGRGSRPHPGKNDFIVLDHADNTRRHEPYGMFEDAVPWNLDGEAVEEGAKKPPPVATCKHAYRWPDGRHDPPTVVRGVQLPCYATFRAGPKECPFCGLPMTVTAKKVEVEHQDLQEMTARSKRIPTEAEKREFLRLLSTARQKGYKAGWARFRFGERFGYAPPVEWLPGAKELREALIAR